MIKSEEFTTFIEYTFEKIEKHFEEVDLYNLSCICDIEYGIMLMFFDFPMSIRLENLLKINQKLDDHLAAKAAGK